MITLVRYLLIVIWSVLMITSSIILSLLLFNRKLPLIMARTMWAPGILLFSGVSLKIDGIDNFDYDKPYIFVSNHLSYLDIPSLFRAIPVNLHFIAKKEVKSMPFIGWYMMATGMIFVDRNNKEKAIESMNQAGQLIKNGKNVLVFPEGTRSKDGNVGRFKKGAFMLAAKSSIQVVPVAIDGTNEVIANGGLRIIPQEVRVAIGKPVDPPPVTEDIDLFINKIRGEVDTLKGQMEIPTEVVLA